MITVKSLKHYDEKSKNLISQKQDQLKGTSNQIVSFDEDGKVISKDFSENAEKITYTNEKYSQFTNVNSVLNNLLEKVYYIKPTCSLWMPPFSRSCAPLSSLCRAWNIPSIPTA